MAIPASAGDQPFSAEDAWVYPFSSGAPGTGKDVPAFISLTSDPQVTTVEHRGDNRVIASGRTLDSVELEAVFGRWNMDAIAAMVGGTIASAGTTPNQIRTLTHKVTDQPADCAIAAQTRSRSADGGGLLLVFPRCQPSNIPNYGMADQEFNDLTVQLVAVANDDDEIVIVRQLETYTDLTSTFPIA